MSQLPASHVLVALSGQSVSADIQAFMAPLAAILIGVMGIRYLVGEQKSPAGFIGFLLLGIVVYVLIQFGGTILSSLGNLFRSWAGSSFFNIVGIVVLVFLGVGVLSAVAWVARAERRVKELQDRLPGSTGEKDGAVLSRAEYTRRLCWGC